MRIKNKEIRNRRHRKEQKIKEAERQIRAQYGDKKDAPKVAKSPAAKTAPKKAPATGKKKAEA
jgi:hypothetical protein